MWAVDEEGRGRGSALLMHVILIYCSRFYNYQGNNKTTRGEGAFPEIIKLTAPGAGTHFIS